MITLNEEKINLTDKEVIEKLQKLYDKLSYDFDFYFYIKGLIEIKLSKRLRSCNGHIEYYYNYDGGEFVGLKNVKITMSLVLLNEFGWERFEKTFRHELAHLITSARTHTSGHNLTFKKYCKMLGGSMNTDMAGNGEFEQCGTKEFLKTIKKYKYRCPKCGQVYARAKLMARHIINNPRRICGTNNCETPVNQFELTIV